MPLEQIAIAFTGAAAIFLSQSKSERLRKFACVFGLAGQPFWFSSAIAAQQWGIFTLCFFYTFSWARGVWNFWLAPLVDRHRANRIAASVTAQLHPRRP